MVRGGSGSESSSGSAEPDEIALREESSETRARVARCARLVEHDSAHDEIASRGDEIVSRGGRAAGASGRHLGSCSKESSGVSKYCERKVGSSSSWSLSAEVRAATAIAAAPPYLVGCGWEHEYEYE